MANIKAEDTISLASVKTVNDAAEFAKDRATAAEQAASRAESNAAIASAAATRAENKAIEANTYANSALSQLGIVEDVIGVLTWASEHGSFTLTSDTTVQEGKVYFTYDSSTGDYTPVVTPASNPRAAGYYELTVDEAMETFIMSHLTVTSRGLWVLPNGIKTGTVTPASGETEDDARARLGNKYKVLLSSDGMYVYDGTGALVTTYGESITFSANRVQHIGNNNAYIVFDPTGSGSLTIGGASILFGSQTLDQVLASKANTSDIPTNVSDLNNDSGFLTDVDVSVTQTSTGADITVNGDTVSISNGAQGPQGVSGDDGTSVNAITLYYKLATTTPVIDPQTFPTGWSDTQPELDLDYNCYVVIVTDYDDNSREFSTVSLFSEYIASIQALEVANTAQETADTTQTALEGEVYWQYTDDGVTYDVSYDETGGYYYYYLGDVIVQVPYTTDPAENLDKDPETGLPITVNLGGINQSIEGIYDEQDSLDERLGSVESDQEDIKGDIETIQGEQDGIKEELAERRGYVAIDSDALNPSITIQAGGENADTKTEFTSTRIAFKKGEQIVLYIDSTEEEGLIDISSARIGNFIRIGDLEIFKTPDKGIGVRRA